MDIKNNVLFKKKELLNFCVLRFIFGISYSFMIPIIPLYFDSIGIATIAIGTIMSLYGVGKALAQVIFGLITEKLGDKVTLVAILGLMTVVPFLYTIVHTKMLASTIYVIQGTVLGMAAPATYSILARSLDYEKRGECTGYASAVFTLGGGIGAAIGGFIVARLTNYNLVFYMACAGIAMSCLFALFKIKKPCIEEWQEGKDDQECEKSTKVKKEDYKDEYKYKYEEKKDKNKYEEKKEKCPKNLNGIWEELKNDKLWSKVILLASIAFLGDYIYGCVVSIFPFYGQEVLGTSAAYTSAIISIYLFVFGIFAPLGGWTCDKIGNNRQLFLSFIVMSATLLGISLSRSKVIFAIIIVIYFLGATFLNSSLQSLLSEFGENNKIKGIVFGLVGASESIGYAVSPILSAYVYEWNKLLLFVQLLAFSLGVFGIFLLLRKKANIIN